MRIYTRHGDDGSTSLRVGERVRKDDERVALLGDLDEGQAALGLARAECERGGALDELLLGVERDLWLVMAAVAVPAERETAGGAGSVTAEMVARLEHQIDEVKARVELSPNFSVPGGSRLSAALDFARTVIRRAERAAVALGCSGALLAYVNRLSDLCWVLARDAEGEHLVHRRTRGAPSGSARGEATDSEIDEEQR